MTVATAPAITEKQLREQVRDLCKVFGWRLAFTQYSIRSPKGFPDLVLVRPPRLIFAELKSEKGKTTAEQEAWLEDLRVVHNGVVLAVTQCCMGFDEARMHEHHHRTARGIAPTVEVYLWRPIDIETVAEILR